MKYNNDIPHSYKCAKSVIKTCVLIAQSDPSTLKMVEGNKVSFSLFSKPSSSKISKIPAKLGAQEDEDSAEHKKDFITSIEDSKIRR